MLARGLAISEQRAVPYFRNAFADDLKLVTEAATNAEHPTSLSVASFCPDFPKDPMFSEPARRFAGLREQRWFLSSLFVSQLACQASHSPGKSYYYGPPTVLVGLLSSAHSIVHPAFLLLVLALYREPVQSIETGSGLSAILAAQLQDLREASEAGNLAVFRAMHAALEDEQMPTSLRAFVPYGDEYRYTPDQHALHAWRAGLQGELGAAAA
jgi:hypothetical protein